MAVPAHDSRDYAFARQFNLPIIPLIEGCDVSQESFDAKEGIMCNSGFLSGMSVKEAIPAAIDYVESNGIGSRKINYRLRDAIFSRQRYWGEPSYLFQKTALACPMPLSALPLTLPSIDDLNLPRVVSHLWQELKIGSMMAILSKKAQCPALPAAVPII